ncbi:OppA family ABC transporter substrate-binding lipoprotein [[Mycoplasma] mobile]|uniref:Putative membrane protein n=1 Tax=Mycoplasma mobile (strain ATCC 43663 / 163K / NCTC 11711) TaxID=267748 RepID=Q6KHJ2_MYCM1|nr:hypothetical protein [[Mycoplasma] mobile]AAT27938.1 putative membrane protein [Mycoplasma mobile 163K]
MVLKKFIKFSIGSTILVGIVGGVVAAAVINQNRTSSIEGFTNANELSLSRKRQYIQEFNSSLPTPNYNYDYSASFGGLNSIITSNTSAGMFRLETLNSPVFNNSTGAVEIPTLVRYKMIYGSKIIVTYANGATREFDNDNVDQPSPEDFAKNNSAVFFQTSQDLRSINSPEFVTALNPIDPLAPKAIKLQIGIKQGLKWTDVNGNATKYEIVPEDFYYSFMRTNLLTASFRRANGGSKEIDDALRTIGVSTRFGDTDRYSNAYLFGIFNVSSQDILDRTKTITTINGEKYFTLNATSEQIGANFYDTFSKLLNNDLTLSAAPSQFIQEMSQKQSSLPFETNPTNISGLAKEFQIYDYGFESIPSGPLNGLTSVANREYRSTTTLFASPYIPTTIDPAAGRLIYRQNRNYVEFLDSNRNFVDDNTLISEQIERYIPSINQDVFIQQSFNSFRNKDIDILGYNFLSNAQQQQVSQIARRTTQLVNNQLLLRTVPVSAPSGGGIDANGNSKYNFNNAYALLNYGHDLASLNTGNVATTEAYFGGFGQRFRSILQSAINWYSYASTVSAQEASPWINTFAPDAFIGGIDQNSSSHSTLRTGNTTLDGTNNTFTVQDVIAKRDANGNRIFSIENVVANIETVVNELFLLNSNFEVLDSTNSLKDYHVFLQNLSNLTNQFKSLVFEKAALEMKTLLDEFYALHPNTNRTIDWNLSYTFIGTPSNAVTSAYNEVVNTINALDSRLNVSFYVPSTVPNILARITGGFSSTQFSGWGYDYNGIGTAFDGTTHGNATGIVQAFSYYSKLDPNHQLVRTFPEFYKVSLAFKEIVGNGTTNPEFRVAIPFDQWDALTNNQLNHLEESLRVQIGTNPDGSPIFSNISEAFAKFWIGYQNRKTNRDLIALAREFNTIKGNSLEMSRTGNQSTVSSGNLTNVLVQPRFSLPVFVRGVLYQNDIRINLDLN